jgi:small subunit ribosomal protein S20
MPVTKSARKALRVATRRHEENLRQRSQYKKAVKAVKQAVESSTGKVGEIFSKAQSALDKAAKHNTIHPNKAARLKSRLSKLMAKGPKESVTTSNKPTTTKTKATKTTVKKKNKKSSP